MGSWGFFEWSLQIGIMAPIAALAIWAYKEIAKIRRLAPKILAKFDTLESELVDDVAGYQFFEPNDHGFWAPMDYSEFKADVHEGYEKLGQKNGPICWDFAWRIDQQTKQVFVNYTDLTRDPEDHDWDNRKIFKEWSERQTSVDDAIADYKRNRRMARQGQPKPKWWQFWKID